MPGGGQTSRSADRAPGALAPLAPAAALLAPGACGRDIDPASLGPQPTPEESLRAYVRVLELREKDPTLPLYTPETRLLLADAEIGDGHQETELRSLRPTLAAMTVRRLGDLAVVRFGPEHPRVSPYFFRRGADGWMLDLATASRVIGFGRGNRWMLRSRDHEYAFAFE